jgi:thymidylate synthase
VKPYLDLLQKILCDGEDVQSGAVIKSEDRKATCRFLLGQQLRFDLRRGFPCVTTKPVPFDIVVDEVLWFLRGETAIDTLGRAGPDGKFIRRHIWDAWAGPDGDVPYIYGDSWRSWEHLGTVWDANHTTGVSMVQYWDQVARVLANLRAVVADPGNRARRRIIISAWNPPLVPEMGLAPCHTLSQWLPTNGRLDVVCHWRSIDMFLGAPFNIVQYALLAHIFAGLAGLKVGTLVCNIADCHLYDNQFAQVREQLTREPRALPELEIDPQFFATCPDLAIEQVKQVDPAWFRLIGYDPHRGKLKAEVAV